MTAPSSTRIISSSDNVVLTFHHGKEQVQYEIDEELFEELQALEDGGSFEPSDNSMNKFEDYDQDPIKHVSCDIVADTKLNGGNNNTLDTLDNHIKTGRFMARQASPESEECCASTVTSSGVSEFTETTDDYEAVSLRKLLKAPDLQAAIAKAEHTIAELFPEATIMFADIVGFTAWSSIREATQVFTLLESIFQAFDQIASRHKVFKVETVGDCYVAVCGLPERNRKHAVVMARCARECVDSFDDVIRGLEKSLGPDTAELAVRIGLNSGPVTAGILRGERARLQLFGDTVNTAARIEGTGMRDRIHISENTANLLKKAGKEDWITPRKEVVSAKGKGRMVTFWLNRRTGITSSAHGHREKDEVSYERRIGRCIDWNTELLMELLRKVVAHRQAVNGKASSLTMAASAELKSMARTIGDGALVVDEVAHIIELPEPDARADTVKPDSVEIPRQAALQCRKFVKLIASLYNDNPFHNFEHATHVTMATNKLLSRVIAPKLDEDEMEDDEYLIHDHTYGITSSPITQFAVCFSALVHDVDHRGVPNNILANEDKCLGRAYQNKSVAEQNSVDVAWEALLSDEFEAFRGCIFETPEELRHFRELIVNSVIATDIFDKEQSTLRKNRWAEAFAESHKDITRKDINRKATIVIEHMIQASDVAHTMQHWHIYQKWNERLFQETYEAFLDKRSEKDPSEGWYKGELWFFDNYVIPLAKKLENCGVFGVSSDEFLNYATANRDEWAIKGEEIVKQFKEKYSR